MSAYIHAFSNPTTIHATCQDFRAGAGIDLEMDKADVLLARKLNVRCGVVGR